MRIKLSLDKFSLSKLKVLDLKFLNPKLKTIKTNKINPINIATALETSSILLTLNSS